MKSCWREKRKSIKALSDALNVLYPEIGSVSVGQLDEPDKNGEPIQKHSKT